MTLLVNVTNETGEMHQLETDSPAEAEDFLTTFDVGAEDGYQVNLQLFSKDRDEVYGILGELAEIEVNAELDVEFGEQSTGDEGV